MDRTEIARLSAGARQDLPGIRRFIRCELPYMDDEEVRRRLVEEYERGAELEAAEAEVDDLKTRISVRNRELEKKDDEIFELEDRLEDARQCFEAVRYALKQFDGPVAQKLEALLLDPQDTETREELRELADQMKEKP